MIFFDMDGTLAKFFYDKDCLKRMYEKNYFLNLKPYKLLALAKELTNDNNVAIISACIQSEHCIPEKEQWLKQYFPECKNIHLVQCGTNKAEYIAQHYNYTAEPMILIDDYSVNIKEWEQQGFIGIKFCNGINNKSNKEYKYKFRTNKQLKHLLTTLLSSYETSL
jgi:5'(3')-deoxyribonucleotidase